jgi:hypothetical protein
MLHSGDAFDPHTRSNTLSLSVYAERLAAERELFSRFSVQQMEEIAAESKRSSTRPSRWCGRTA